MIQTPQLALLATLSGVLAFGLPAQPTALAQSLGGESTAKRNLDLPFDASGAVTAEEDLPEIVLFYGQRLEGDGFFYVIDRSTTMQDRGELAIAKREVSRNVAEFSGRVRFGIVFFDANVVQFPLSGRPVSAHARAKAGALSWIASVEGGAGSCCQKGLLAGLRLANFSSARRKVVVYVGDGGGTCDARSEVQYLQATRRTVTQQNYQRVTINTIGVLMDNRTLQEDFLKALAAQNNGDYRRVN